MMNSKSQKYQKRRFITLTKQTLILFVFLAFIGIANGQTSNKEKYITAKSKDTIAKTKGTAAKTEKELAITDTIKKSSPFSYQKEVGVDSLFVGSGKLQLFKGI